MKRILIALASLPMVYAHDGAVATDEVILGIAGAMVLFAIILMFKRKMK